jgi:hypothetical protein
VSALARWVLGLAVAALVLVAPIVDFRWKYTYAKRLREVVPGKVYRSGQLTAPGFACAVKRFGLRTIINLQEDYPDPDIALGYFTADTIKESDLCRRLGVRFVFIGPDTLPRRELTQARPVAIDRFLAILDNADSYPVLLHCRAGLHRTGVMTAVYRMEYQGWSKHEAIAELKDNGFGEWPCSSANDYIAQYILGYRPGLRFSLSAAAN